MEPWEDELLWDDDFSEEEKDAEEQIEKTGLEMDADGFADWEDSSDGAPEDRKNYNGICCCKRIRFGKVCTYAHR